MFIFNDFINSFMFIFNDFIVNWMKNDQINAFIKFET